MRRIIKYKSSIYENISQYSRRGNINMLKANGVAKRKRNYTNQSIEKAISILNAFSVEHPEKLLSS